MPVRPGSDMPSATTQSIGLATHHTEIDALHRKTYLQLLIPPKYRRTSTTTKSPAEIRAHTTFHEIRFPATRLFFLQDPMAPTTRGHSQRTPTKPPLRNNHFSFFSGTCQQRKRHQSRKHTPTPTKPRKVVTLTTKERVGEPCTTRPPLGRATSRRANQPSSLSGSHRRANALSRRQPQRSFESASPAEAVSPKQAWFLVHGRPRSERSTGPSTAPPASSGERATGAMCSAKLAPFGSCFAGMEEKPEDGESDGGKGWAPGEEEGRETRA